jgi:hypothetical protein
MPFASIYASVAALVDTHGEFPGDGRFAGLEQLAMSIGLRVEFESSNRNRKFLHVVRSSVLLFV